MPTKSCITCLKCQTESETLLATTSSQKMLKFRSTKFVVGYVTITIAIIVKFR